MKRRIVDPQYARGEQYRAIINEINAKGRCPFCPDNFVYHKRPILKRCGRWFITRNFNAYPGARYHFIIIARNHKEHLGELTPRDFSEIGQLLRWAERTFGLRGGAFAMRFGNTRYTGATVCHLHCHLIVPKLRYRVVNSRRRRLARTVAFPIG